MENVKGVRAEWTDANWAFTNGAEGAKVDEEEIDFEKTWSIVDFNDIRAAAAANVLDAEQETLEDEHRDRLEAEAMRNWNKFYSFHRNQFFKERNYLHRNFTELDPSSADYNRGHQVVMEAGCGTGSTTFPLMALDAHRKFIAFDFAPGAVELVRKSAQFSPDRLSTFVCDLTVDVIPLADESVDIVLLVFVLSAIAPEKMVRALRELHRVMKPGGHLLFRDYGLYDMTQMRFKAKKGRKIAENFYMRADGTRTYFFSIERVKELFAECGFVDDTLAYDTRELRNRKRKIQMYRVWVGGRVVKPQRQAQE
jgi:SAM-dependent methyltransferase